MGQAILSVEDVRPLFRWATWRRRGVPCLSGPARCAPLSSGPSSRHSIRRRKRRDASLNSPLCAFTPLNSSPFTLQLDSLPLWPGNYNSPHYSPSVSICNAPQFVSATPGQSICRPVASQSPSRTSRARVLPFDRHVQSSAMSSSGL
jgi:hypothetical protein